MNDIINETNIRERCLEVIEIVAPELFASEIGIDEKIEDWFDDIDFAELLLEAEIEFNCIINEENTTINDFEKVADLLDWLIKKVILTNIKY